MAFFKLKVGMLLFICSATYQWFIFPFGDRGHDAVNFQRHANFRCWTDLETLELAWRCYTSLGPLATAGLTLLILK
jgi:hypothetical protein